MRRQGGAFAVMMPALVLLIFGFFAMALDLSRAYNRKVELQKAADVIALAAAAQLNGTADGVNKAVTAASDAAGNTTYGYRSDPIPWSKSAISFGQSPNGNWSDDVSASAQPGKIFFVKVDTAELPDEVGTVSMVFIRQLAPTQVSARAVAGRSAINVTPLAICAMSDQDRESWSGELVEHGFRRGISYNLMKLNPYGNQAENFLVNPFVPPGTTGTSLKGNLEVVKPFVCTGTIAMPTLTGGTITVERGFPLDSLFSHLNSRFGGTYSAPCTAATAPPDTNIREFTAATQFPWLNATPNQSAANDPATTSTILKTIGNLPPAQINPSTTTAAMYGPLWVYAKPVPYTSLPEPAGGYTTTFSPADWSTIYSPKNPSLKSGKTYPTPTPNANSSYQSSPSPLKGMANRRVLNIPLLRCPVPPGSLVGANVVAIGKFFMTIKASSTDLYAEFGGVAQESSLGGAAVELYR
jgi:hypothetical protein